MSEKRTRTVVFHLDPLNPPAMTPEEMAELDELPDEAIDYSDIPSVAGRRWVRGGDAATMLPCKPHK